MDNPKFLTCCAVTLGSASHQSPDQESLKISPTQNSCLIFLSFPCRTSHYVVLGEHDRSSNAEDIQRILVGGVGNEQLLILLRCCPFCLPNISMSFPARCSSIPNTAAMVTTMTLHSSSWPAQHASALMFPQFVWWMQEANPPQAGAVWPAAGAWPTTLVSAPALNG